MATSGPLVEELSTIISQATAPAFLLGSVAAFVSLLLGRQNRIVDRCAIVTSIKDNDQSRALLKNDIPRLKHRARLVNRAIEFAVISGVSTTFLVIIAFASAVLNIHHAYGSAVLFAIALGFFAASLICLWLEVRIALSELDYQL